MGKPIVFATKPDRREGRESITLVFRADRDTTAGEVQMTIPAIDLDNEAPGRLKLFADDASAVLQRAWDNGVREEFAVSEPLQFEETDRSSTTLAERLAPWIGDVES